MNTSNRMMITYYAALYGIFLLLSTGLLPSWGRWYSQNQYHRIQAERLMEGHLSISDTPTALDHDLTWSKDGVHQVWGLGVPLWQMMLNAIARLAGEETFPDILAFGVAASVTAGVVFLTFLPVFLKVGSIDSDWSFATTPISTIWYFGVVALILFFPPFVNLIGSRFDVYDQVVAYEYLYATTILCVLVNFCRARKARTYFLLCLISGVGGFVRPTLLFYGGSAVTLATVSWWKSRQLRYSLSSQPERKSNLVVSVEMVAGVSIFLLGGTLLYVSNAHRFGDGFEFGHKLNVQEMIGSMYATRFDHPFEKVPVYKACVELFGHLFLVRQFSYGNFYQAQLVLGQADALRWRDLYLTTFDVSYFVLLICGFAFILIYKMRAASRLNKWKPQLLYGDNSSITLTQYSLLSSVFLIAFYLKCPVIASRYLLDFMPSFVALFVAVCIELRNMMADRFSKPMASAVVFLLTIHWVLYEFRSGSRAYEPPLILDYTEVQRQRAVFNAEIASFPPSGTYSSRLEAQVTGVPFNGTGWEHDGTLMPLFVLIVNDPQYLELHLMQRTDSTNHISPQHIRAKIGLESLIQESARQNGSNLVVRFRGPRQQQFQQGIHPIFVATVANSELAQESTPWLLQQVRWRDSKPTSSH